MRMHASIESRCNGSARKSSAWVTPVLSSRCGWPMKHRQQHTRPSKRTRSQPPPRNCDLQAQGFCVTWKSSSTKKRLKRSIRYPRKSITRLGQQKQQQRLLSGSDSVMIGEAWKLQKVSDRKSPSHADTHESANPSHHQKP